MKDSELILNPDGSVYHLALRAEDIADTIILVGDPDRVPLVSNYFDTIDLKRQKREFITHTGWIGKKRISVLSTGIGTDNIDIVMNELDALVNIDFKTRKVNPSLTSLTTIRLGTSGGIHPEIKIDDLVVSKYAIGTDALGQYYTVPKSPDPLFPEWSYLTSRYDFDLSQFTNEFIEGTTLTAAGFYHPQGRKLRISSGYELPFEKFKNLKINGTNITNMEMETSAIYLLANLLGHKGISFNAVVAQRLHGVYSKHPEKTVDKLIRNVLDWITTSS
jgi:uridine phosphorylase